VVRGQQRVGSRFRSAVFWTWTRDSLAGAMGSQGVGRSSGQQTGQRGGSGTGMSVRGRDAQFWRGRYRLSGTQAGQGDVSHSRNAAIVDAASRNVILNKY
jgi:hypothetical protein